MTEQEKLEKKIRETKIAIDIINEEREFYSKLWGEKGMEKWFNFQLEDLKKHIDALARLKNKQ